MALIKFSENLGGWKCFSQQTYNMRTIIRCDSNSGLLWFNNKVFTRTNNEKYVFINTNRHKSTSTSIGRQKFGGLLRSTNILHSSFCTICKVASSLHYLTSSLSSLSFSLQVIGTFAQQIADLHHIIHLYYLVLSLSVLLFPSSIFLSLCHSIHHGTFAGNTS